MSCLAELARAIHRHLLMRRNPPMKNKTLLYGLIGLLVLAATATGVFYQTQGAHIEYVTVRGEPATFQGSGLYQYDPVAGARAGNILGAVYFFIGLAPFFPTTL